MEANKIYQLIRANAGSKMVREAEKMIAYDYVNELLSEQQQSEAIQRMSRFLMEYPVPEKESQPNLLNFSEVAQIDFKDLQEIQPVLAVAITHTTLTQMLHFLLKKYNFLLHFQLNQERVINFPQYQKQDRKKQSKIQEQLQCLPLEILF